MVVKVRKPHIDEADYALDISSGGTSSMTVMSTQLKLGYVKNSELGENDGVAKNNSNGKLSSSVLSGEVQSDVVNSISPSTVAYGGANNTFIITNYDSFNNYVVSTTNGTVSISEDTITYTPVNANGAGGFTVNGEFFSIQVLEKRPVTPSIISPVNGVTNISKKAACTSSAFAMTSGSDTHAASHWQISTSSTFTTILYESVDDTVNKTSWTSGTLNTSTTYYIRVRYKGQVSGYSGWSATIQVATKSSFLFSDELQKTTISGGVSSDQYGYSVSLSTDGSTAAIGAVGVSSNTGAVFILVKTGAVWVLQQKLTASDQVAGDQFGSAVSLSSDGAMVLIGAPSKASNAGAAYIFTRTGSTWTPQQKLVSTDIAAGDYFGISVSLSGDGLYGVIGAYYKTNYTGAAYVFIRSGSTWTQQQKLAGTDIVAADVFGVSVSISATGTMVLVGAYNKSSTAGAAYVFTRSGVAWTQQQKLVSTDIAASDYFGYSVYLSGDTTTAVVGSFGKTSFTGAAYVFTRSGSVWTQQAKLVASAPATSDYFGRSVCMSNNGSVVLVGAYGRTSATGICHAYTRTGSTWSVQQVIQASDAVFDEYFGWSTAMSSDATIALVGAYMEDSNGLTNGGAGYFYN